MNADTERRYWYALMHSTEGVWLLRRLAKASGVFGAIRDDTQEFKGGFNLIHRQVIFKIKSLLGPEFLVELMKEEGENNERTE